MSASHPPYKFSYCATVPIEIAHHGIDGSLHGHTLVAEVWTHIAVDLDCWKKAVEGHVEPLERDKLENIAGRTFEDVVGFIFTQCPDAYKVTIRLPSRGHAIEAVRY